MVRELRTTAKLQASPGQVCAAWSTAARSTAEQIARWWGPAGFHSTVKDFSFTESARFDVVMHGPDGTDYPNLSVFDELIEPSRIRWS